MIKISLTTSIPDELRERFSWDIRQEFPDIQGFSPRNIWRMRAFYLAYTKEVRNLPQPAADFDGENLQQMRQFYLAYPPTEICQTLSGKSGKRQTSFK